MAVQSEIIHGEFKSHPLDSLDSLTQAMTWWFVDWRGSGRLHKIILDNDSVALNGLS